MADQTLNPESDDGEFNLSSERDKLSSGRDEDAVIEKKRKTIQGLRRRLLNVGGRFIPVEKELIPHLKLDPMLFSLYPEDTDTRNRIPFMDRDPDYFMKMSRIFKHCGYQKRLLKFYRQHYSARFLGELSKYGLISEKYVPKPKIVLEFDKRVERGIINLQIGEDMVTISQNTYTYTGDLSGFEPAIAKKIINFVRLGFNYRDDRDIKSFLDRRQLSYRLEKDSVVLLYEPVDIGPVKNQLSYNYELFEDYKETHAKGEDYRYDNTSDRITDDVEHYNIINTQSPLLLGGEIIFYLGGDVKYHYLSNMYLIVDLPIVEGYISPLSPNLLESVTLYKNRGSIISSDNADSLYHYPLIYLPDGTRFNRELEKRGDTQIHILYQGKLIAIHRLVIPLFFLYHNYLPLREQGKYSLVVKTHPATRLLKNGEAREIPLLNMYLQVQTIVSQNLPKKNSIYLFTARSTYQMQMPVSADFPVLQIDLNGFGLIKDFWFYFTKGESLHPAKKENILIEIEIIQKRDKAIHSRIDALTLNLLIPVQKLGHILESGLYYHSFSTDPLENKMLGGLNGEDYILQIKTTQPYILHFCISEYYYEMIH